MSAAENLPETAAQIEPEAVRALEQLRSRVPLATLLINEVDRRAAALEAVIESLGTDVKVVWVSNPLRSPLTIERIFLQAAGPEADLRVERSPAELAEMLRHAAGDARSLLLILQQPETMDATARDTLAEIAAVLMSKAGHAPDSPAVQVLFSGTPAFRMVQSRRQLVLAPRREMLAYECERQPTARRREALPLLLLLLIAGVGAWTTPVLLRHTVTPGRQLQADRSDPLMRPSPATAPESNAVETLALPAIPPASAAQPTAIDLSPSPVPAPAIDVAALRREFDAFLAQRAPTLPDLSDRQKEALFQEFLARHQPRSASKQM